MHIFFILQQYVCYTTIMSAVRRSPQWRRTANRWHDKNSLERTRFSCWCS